MPLEPLALLLDLAAYMSVCGMELCISISSSSLNILDYMPITSILAVTIIIVLSVTSIVQQLFRCIRSHVVMIWSL